MNKEEALIEFLNGLRVAINNSLAYSRQHPFFLKTSQDFKIKIEQAFNFLSPLKIGVSSDSLFIEGKPVEKIAFSAELSHILHLRKIKSLEFKPGLNVEELADFLSLLSLQPKEIIKAGGLNGLLQGKRIQHIGAEDLDYSQLLGSQEEGTKDIWLYLFKQAVSAQDGQKMLNLADNFPQGANALCAKDIVEDDKLRDGLGVFFKHLKDNAKEKFSQCSREFSQSILNSSSQLSDGDFGKLKEAFSNFDDDDFSGIFSSQLTSGKFDVLNLGLFSRLAGEERSGKIFAGLADNSEARAALKNNPAALKKIQSLLSSVDIESIPGTYRSTLIALVKNISLEGSFAFDLRQLRVNYRLIILDLLLQSEVADDLTLILKRLDGEWEDLAKEKDFEFLKKLLTILKENKLKISRDISDGLQRRIAAIVEVSIWGEDEPAALGYLVENLEKVSEPADFYLNKIFGENGPSLYGIKLFLRFFPSQLSVFYEKLKERHSDLEFLSRIINIIGQVGLPVSAAVLKEIFSFGNDLIKIEVLRAMRLSKFPDPEFLFAMLKDKNTILRREAFGALLDDPAVSQRAIGILLNIRNPLGLENRLILENILIVEESGARGARDYLKGFSKKRFFWNKMLRDKARQVLEDWR